MLKPMTKLIEALTAFFFALAILVIAVGLFG